MKVGIIIDKQEPFKSNKYIIDENNFTPPNQESL